MSNRFDFVTGIEQGSFFGQYLFILYIYHILLHVSNDTFVHVSKHIDFKP